MGTVAIMSPGWVARMGWLPTNQDIFIDRFLDGDNFFQCGRNVAEERFWQKYVHNNQTSTPRDGSQATVIRCTSPTSTASVSSSGSCSAPDSATTTTIVKGEQEAECRSPEQTNSKQEETKEGIVEDEIQKQNTNDNGQENQEMDSDEENDTYSSDTSERETRVVGDLIMTSGRSLPKSVKKVPVA